MKLRTNALFYSLLLLGYQTSRAQNAFDSGSDGSLGPLVVPAGNALEIELPSDGVLNYTTVSIEENAVVRFSKNSSNTPVYMLATGDVRITGSIELSGETSPDGRGGAAGPGGFDGGVGGTSPSTGQGPGGGQGGWTNPPDGETRFGGGSYGTVTTSTTYANTSGQVYGNRLIIPLVGGSGGGGANSDDIAARFGGGGGGGAILIASNTEIIFDRVSTNSGVIRASGGSGSSSFSVGSGGGSGGAIRIVAPKVSGSGTLLVRGGSFRFVGNAGSPSEGSGGFGRVRIDSLNYEEFFINDDRDGSRILATYGANMVVFPPLPSIRVTEAAGQTIALTQTDPVFVLLPTGTPSTQTIEVSVTDFKANVPLVAVVTPEAGDRQEFEFSVNNTSGGTSSGSVQVEIPPGVTSRVDVWTR